MAIRWGIASVGKISNDFVQALSLLPKEEHSVEAVAARDLSRAKAFADTFSIPRSYGSYEELANDKNLDIIYIGSIHTMHLPLCKLFIGEGHNVLCEKPLVMNARQCKELIALAKSKAVFLMEAYWSRFFPIYDELRSLLKSGSIGEPQFVSANFGGSVLDMQIPRIMEKDLAGGGLLDMGCYPIQFVQMVYNHEMPKVVAAGFLNETSGIDETVTATLLYSGHRMAVVTCSLRCTLDQQATICSSKKLSDKETTVIKVKNFWTPERMETPSGVIEHKLPDTGKMNFLRSEGLIYEAQAVRHCLKNGLKEHPHITLENSLQICEIMDEIRKQIGLVYDEDLQK